RRKLATADNSFAHARTASKRWVISADAGLLSVRRNGKRAWLVTTSRKKSPRCHSRDTCAFKSIGLVHLPGIVAGNGPSGAVRRPGFVPDESVMEPLQETWMPASLSVPDIPQWKDCAAGRLVRPRCAQSRRWKHRAR